MRHKFRGAGRHTSRQRPRRPVTGIGSTQRHPALARPMSRESVTHRRRMRTRPERGTYGRQHAATAAVLHLHQAAMQAFMEQDPGEVDASMTRKIFQALNTSVVPPVEAVLVEDASSPERPL